jgi:hypothetical protein
MLYTVYLKKRTVYIPTVAQLATGAYSDEEPVAEVSVTNTEGLRRALLDTIARGNAIIPNPQKDKWPPPVLLKYAGAKSWSAFMRGTMTWNIKEYDGAYQIIGNLVHAIGDSQEDPAQKIILPPGSNANDAIDRMIEILQDAAHG